MAWYKTHILILGLLLNGSSSRGGGSSTGISRGSSSSRGGTTRGHGSELLSSLSNDLLQGLVLQLLDDLKVS
jgi:hypothetical protein